MSGDNSEKIWAHWFLAKQQTIAAGALGGAVSPQDLGQCLGEDVSATTPQKI